MGPKKKILAAPNVAVAPAPVIFGPQNTPRSTEHSDFWPDEAAPNVAVAPAPVISGPRNTPRSTEHNDFWPDKAAPNVAVAPAPVNLGHQNTPRSTGHSDFWPDELYFNAAFLPASPPSPCSFLRLKTIALARGTLILGSLNTTRSTECRMILKAPT